MKTVFKPTIKRRDMDAVLRCLVDESIGPGEYAEMLVKQIVSELGLAGGVALREYGRAIETAIDALALPEGARVLVSALAPSLYFRVLTQKGMVPVVGDVDTGTGVLASEVLASAEGKNIQAIVLNFPLGVGPGDDECANVQIPVVEDISFSFGVKTEEYASGSCGRYVLLRMEEDGVITAGGGAAVFARHKRAVGELRSALAEMAEFSAMPNLNASLASVQFKYFQEFAARRRAIAEIYAKALAGGKHTTPAGNRPESSSHALFPVILNGSRRDAAVYAKSNGVPTFPAFERSILAQMGSEDLNCPNAAALALRSLLFPLYPMLKRDEIERVAKVLATLP